MSVSGIVEVEVDHNDPFWMSERVLILARARDLGGLIKCVRETRKITQKVLAPQVNVSTSTLSRFESGAMKSPDIRLAMALAEKLAIPIHLVGVALGLSEDASASVRPLRISTEEDPIHRRSFLTLAGLTVPSVLLSNLTEVLAGVAPGLDVNPGALQRSLTRTRAMYDRGENGSALQCLPALLQLADQELDSGHVSAMERYCSVNDLATDLLNKVGLFTEARLTAQNSIRVARQTGSPMVMAAADRGLSIVLRHEGNFATANLVSLRAANRIERTGLVNVRQAVSYVQVMSTHAYTAAQNNDRSGALAAIAEAERVAAHLERHLSADVGRRATANARLYRVGVHWSLGDAGTAVEAGQRVDAAALPTPERRARYFTDMARAWWSWGKPDETAISLLTALSHAPAEVLDRVRIRGIADDVVTRHRTSHAVRQLAGKLAAS